MFKIAVDNLVQSIGEDVYLPTPSAASSKNLQPLSLVEREGSILPFRTLVDYYTTDFELSDVLTDRDVEFKLVTDQPFLTFNRESTVKINGKLGGNLKGIFDADIEHVDELTIKAQLGELSISEVDLQSLLDDLHSRKLNMEHELVEQLSSKRRKALCLVTGVVKTTKDTEISAIINKLYAANVQDSDNESESGENSGDAEHTDDSTTVPLTDSKTPLTRLDNLVGNLVDAEMSATHEKESCRTIKLPAGTVVAYQLMELAVSSKGRVKVMVSHGSKGGFHMNSHFPKTKKVS